MDKLKVLFVNVILILVCFQSTTPTHLKGTFHTKEFFKFLIKFGFQKTDRHHKDDTHGYIFGNITSKQDLPVPVTFVVLAKPYFLDYYKNRAVYDRNQACKHMFSIVNTKAFDAKCNPDGKDYLRKIPCPKNELCADEDSPWNVVKGHQFTYVMQDFKQPA